MTTAAIAMTNERFAREYVVRGARRNALLEAAAAAGIGEETARALIRQNATKNRIRELLLEHFDELEITSQRVFEEMGAIAFMDPGELLDGNGDLLPVHRLAPRIRAAISSIDYETRMQGRGDDAIPVHTVKIRFHDKGQMLQLLARHFKIIGDEKANENALAHELAAALRDGRLRAQAARRSDSQPVEEARIIEPAQLPSSETQHEDRIW